MDRMGVHVVYRDSKGKALNSSVCPLKTYTELLRQNVIRTIGDVEDMIYETTLAEAVSGLVVGQKLQVESGGLGVSKPASGEGSFEVVDFEGAAKGDIVHGRWVAATPASAG